jgi:DNA-binding response OmpR family regulator
LQLLIAHGDTAARLAIKRVVADAEELETIESGEGLETLEMLLAFDSPAVAVVDWHLPGLDGPELCRLVHAYHEAGPPYIILLARGDCDVAEGLDAGASDCVRTPVNGAELRARIDVGRRFAALPWERLTGATAAAAAAEGAHEEKFALSAQRSLDGDDPDDEGDAYGAKFELESVLVAQ